jgi:hypothetical protein
MKNNGMSVTDRIQQQTKITWTTACCRNCRIYDYAQDVKNALIGGENEKITIILLHALLLILCAATMGLGMAITLETTLIIHAIAVPTAFSCFWYILELNYTNSTQTASFSRFVIAMDFFVVALLINKSLDMFDSLLGTWIPFVLIFTSTLLTGFFISRRSNAVNIIG